MSTTPPPSPSEGASRCPQTPFKETEYTGRIGELMEQQKQVIESFFGPQFEITYNPAPNKRTFKIRNKSVSDGDSDSASASAGDIDSDNFCAKISIYRNQMYIPNLKKCGENAGTTILRNLIKVANCLKLTEVTLEDASAINGNMCKFPLWLLHILTTGKSWYNKHGFVSDYFVSEFENNSKVITMNAIDFLKRAIEMRSTPGPFGNILEDLNKFEELTPYINEPVSQMVRYITDKYLKSGAIDCNNPIVQWFLKFLIIVRSSKLIDYFQDLKYNPEYDDFKEETGAATGSVAAAGPEPGPGPSGGRRRRRLSKKIKRKKTTKRRRGKRTRKG